MNSGNSNKQFSALDILSFISFLIGLKNYEQNVTQNDIQDTVQSAVSSIQKHLQMQDEKIDFIIKKMEGFEVNEKGFD